MRYLMIVKGSEQSEAGVLPTEGDLTEMGAYNEELLKAGVMLAGDGLQASSKGARVRYANSKATVLDGPFAEAKELVAGFWVIKVKSKAEAVAWAKKVPFKEGEVELRELLEMDDFPVDPAEKADGWREKEQQFLSAPAPARKPGTKRFMVLIKADKFTEGGGVPSEKLFSEMGALMEELVKQGAMLGGEGLKPSSFGARIQYDGDKRTVLDGPFTEAKELVAGYSIIQTATKAEAVEFARRMIAIHVDNVGAQSGETEVRQVFELEDFSVSAEEKAKWHKQEQTLRDSLSH